jgi:hypothetical protein
MRKNFPVCLGCLLLSLVIFNSPCFAWIDTGHKIVALVAWEDLTPKTRAAVTELLKQHPRYEKDLLVGAPDDATPDQLAQHAFAVAATWPDMVRNRSNPMNTLYNHPQWHYIDIPFEDGTTASDEPSNSPGPHNVVEALTQCTDEVKQDATKPDQKAIDLCWIEHLVGDIHQPLHAASRYSPQFPKGDAGGNSEVVLRDPPYPDSAAKLHLIWDSFPGDYQSEFVDHYIAAGLRADPQYSREQFKSLLESKDFMAWAQESHEIAVKDVYLNGQLETATAPRGGGGRASTQQPIPGLPPGYKEQAEKDAMHQVVLAGYRLADLLNSTFDPKP